MRGYAPFLKKEIIELQRNYKALVMMLIFVTFGILSPVIAKIMPEIISKMAVEGFSITLPEPTFLDAYAQFFKNFTQIGMIVVLLIFAGTFSREITKGTLVMLLSKGLSRDAVILSKYTASVSLWTICYVAAVSLNYGYTNYLFDTASAPQLFISLFCLWLFGAFVIALIVITSILVNGSYGGLLMTSGILVILMLINLIPGVSLYNPLALATENMALLSGTLQQAKLLPAIIITIVLILLSLGSSILMFRKKEL